MAVGSVDSYINAQPEQAMSFHDWHNQNYSGYLDPDSWAGRLSNFFDGIGTRERQEYQTYLDNLNNLNEFKATQSARAWDKSLDDTTYQRTMKDLEAAGLNPYLLVNNGGVTATSGRSAGKADYKYSKHEESKTSGKGRDMALILLAVARLAAALL